MIIININNHAAPQSWPYLKCQLQKGEEIREIYLPIWNCVENVEVDIGAGDMWKVIKVLHPIQNG